MTTDPYAWLDPHIEAQADYWQRQGLPGDIVSQVAELIERYGDDACEAGLIPEEEDHDHGDMTFCPACGGEGSLLGPMGQLLWQRCRACGWEWYEERSTAPCDSADS